MTNVTAQYVTGPEQVKELLVSQVSSQCAGSSVEQMIDDGVDTFIEIGPENSDRISQKDQQKCKALHVEKNRRFG